MQAAQAQKLKAPASQAGLTIGMALLVVALVVAGNAFFAARYKSFVTIFLSIAIEAIPFLLAGSFVSGCIHVFVDRQLLFRFTPRHPFFASLFGAALGLLFPVCECGVIPVIRRLYQKGLPLSVGIAFMLAAPVVNPIVIAGSYAAFGWGPMLLWRVGLNFTIATGIGLVFSFAEAEEALLPDIRKTAEDSDRHADSCECKAEHVCGATSAPPNQSLKERFHESLAVAGDDFQDMLRYVLIGSLIAAGLQTLIPQTVFLQLRSNLVTSILTMMLLAFVLSVCSTADAFLALAFTQTLPLSAVLAFLVFGPMIDIKSTLMLLRVFRYRSIVYVMLLAGMMTLVGTLLMNLVGG